MERHAAPALLQTSRTHRGELACLALAAGAARLASGSGDGALRTWSWRAGGGWEPEAEAPRAHRFGATAARWAGAGALLASGGVDGALRVWGAGLACRRQLAAPGAAAVRALCWAGAGALLAAGHDDGAACVWSVRGGCLVARLSAHEGALHAVATLARGALLLTACTHGTLKVFDLIELCESNDGERSPTPLVWIDDAHDMGVLCAEAARDGRHVATGGHDALVRLWSAEGGAPAVRGAGVLAGHTAAVTALAWGEGAVLASASLDRSARLWAPLEGVCLHAVQAHPRYLTSVALAPDLRYMITGSNDKSFRTWSLGAFSLGDEMQPPCNALAHFAVGDLEGIGPVEVEELTLESEQTQEVGREEGHSGGGGGSCLWRAQAHSGAINCIAAYGEFLATASSDGTVKVWRWTAGAALSAEHVLEAHRYPALACDFGAAGSVLLSAGLDGCAYLWDVQTGVQVRSLEAGGVCGGGGGGGGGGVRGARLSPQRPARALLATDDGLSPLWSVADPDPQPTWVYSSGSAALCCAWSADARVCAVGGAEGELRVLAPPRAAPLHHDAQAHDLGVTSCDFAPSSAAFALPEGTYLLATAGSDSLIKLWTIELREESSGSPRASVVLSRSVEAHGGAASSVRWSVAEGEGEGAGAMLASGGDDGWARAWRVLRSASDGAVSARAALGVQCGAVCALCVRGALVAGARGGELSLWQLETTDSEGADEEAAPRHWREAGVARWLRDYVTRVPGSRVTEEEEAELMRRAREGRLTGARLLDEPPEQLVALLGFGGAELAEEGDGADAKVRGERAEVRARIEDELDWLRNEPPNLSESAPHALLCPLSHRLLHWPTRAADGFTYERENILEWLLAAPPEGAMSPVSGLRLRNTRLSPNYKLRETLRAFLRDQRSAADTADTAADTADTADNKPTDADTGAE